MQPKMCMLSIFHYSFNYYPSSSLQTDDLCTSLGQASEVDIGVSPAESIAVDMYLLMDLSLTMQQDLSMLRMFAGTLGK